MEVRHLKKFMGENFLLQTKTAEYLYHEHAKNMPIFDYHCHLPVEDIAKDICFNNLGQVWLAGDHYKWRLMRNNGITEKYCTGNASDYEKFEKWAETVPMTIRNPLYHWTHLELNRYFNITELLNPTTCKKIYDHCSALLKTPEFSVRNLLIKMNVNVICTTNDPIDSLEFHKRIKNDGFKIKVFPAFRPDKAMHINNKIEYKKYIHKLSDVANIEIEDFTSLMKAIDIRHNYFHTNGCRIADHGIEFFHIQNYTDGEIENIMVKALSEQKLTKTEISKFKSAFLYEVARLNHKCGWVQQFHVGAIRNTNTRMYNQLGSDIGCDSIGDFAHGENIAKFLDRLDQSNELTKTILYSINPRDNELFASIIGNFQDSSFPGKLQFGPAWWFLDQIDGMTKQLNTLSNMGLLSRFIGMTTDSRSFLSFPRHEYFRRILCNLIGIDVENGEIPSDMDLLGKIVENICYNNAIKYFGI